MHLIPYTEKRNYSYYNNALQKYESSGLTLSVESSKEIHSTIYGYMLEKQG